CRMWLNAWYSREIDGLGVGETLRLPLREFKDQYGDSFRGGGFFAPELPERLALAELQIGERMMGVVVVGGEEERDAAGAAVAPRRWSSWRYRGDGVVAASTAAGRAGGRILRPWRTFWWSGRIRMIRNWGWGGRWRS